MIHPTVTQLNAGVDTARAKLTAISANSWINYNNEISDADMLAFVTEIATAILNAQPSKGTTP
jgi:hypothetical protein